MTTIVDSSRYAYRPVLTSVAEASAPRFVQGKAGVGQMTTSYDTVDGFDSMETRRNPYPFYEWTHSSCPVHREPDHGNYLVTRHEDLVYIANNPALFKCGGSRVTETPPGQRYTFVPSLLDEDPPEHSTVRKMAFSLFTPARIRSYEPAIQHEVDKLLDTIDRPEIEFVADFAAPLPARVVGAILGTEPELYDQLREWSDIFLVLTAGFFQPDEEAGLRQGWADFINYCGDTVADRRANPRDDGLTRLATARRPDGELFDINQLAHTIQFLIVGGNDTTRNLLGNAVLDLMGRPDYLERIRTEDGFAERVCEESLRKESPAQFTYRMAVEDVELSGVRIPAGSRVLLAWAAANRDREVFSAPEVFDVDRPDLRSAMAFGHGNHLCLGAPLARLEGAVALRSLYTRYDLELSGSDAYSYATRQAQTRGLKELRLTVRRRNR